MESNTILLREALRDMPPAAAHRAADGPATESIYAPVNHGAALRTDRALVVGNRGVGKSFWSSVLVSDQAREAAATLYRQDELRRTRVALGFHESAGMTNDPAPSADQLAQLRGRGFTSMQIWKSVLLRAIPQPGANRIPDSLAATLAWSTEHIEESEAVLRDADAALAQNKQQFLLVFDALDRLATKWSDVRELTTGLLRFALDVRGFRTIRAKVFLRTDQWHDETIFRFPDASKLRSEHVELKWTQCDLYGLVYQYLWNHSTAGGPFRNIVDEVVKEREYGGLDLQRELRQDATFQEHVLRLLAGEFMGTNPRRGRTYNWLHDHLADARGQTSPRSFQIAIREAASKMSDSAPRVLDHLAIKAGVQAASTVRVEQLTEDYSWIRLALEALEDLEVPTNADTFLRRWEARGTVERIRDHARQNERDAPVAFAAPATPDEEAILQSLKDLGVVEDRADSRINVPDIFRVEAKLKRRGGVRVPAPRRN